MPLDAKQLSTQPTKLRKSLKKLSKDASVANVHKLRTRSRRLEATLHALALESGNGKQLLKAIKPVRSKAGKVRDMDVLTGFASQPRIRGEEECSIQLLEYLGTERDRKARKLLKVAAKHAPKISKGLKKLERGFDKALQTGKNSANEDKWPEEATAMALHLEGEARDWPTLNRKNLHPFRLKVKELRYVLQMAEHSDSEFVDTLGEVKDTIGEWHDWEVLAEIAGEVIQHPGCKLIKEIRSTSEEKFDEALALANQMRKQYLGVYESKARQRNSKKPSTRAKAIDSAVHLAA